MICPGLSHPVTTDKPHMDKRRCEFLHTEVTTPYRLHHNQPNSCGPAQEGTTRSASTQDELEYDRCPDIKTSTIATVARQHATAATTFRRRATGTR